MEIMKIFIPLLALFMMSVQLPFGPQPTEKPEEDRSPVKGWQVVTYFGVPPTQYLKTGPIIKAESVGSRSSLFKEVKDSQKDYPVLVWKWKISNIVQSAIETKKDRFDAAARVMVVFGEEKRFSFFSKEPAGERIEYIWGSHLPPGRVFDDPAKKDSKVFVVESGESKAGKWVSESRNIRKDFNEAFKTDPKGVIAIGIETNTDHSNEMVTAWYSDPALKKRPR